jgi:hypothetical protein
MSTPRSLGNLYTAKSCKGGDRVLGALKRGPVTYQKNIDPLELLEVWRRVDNPTQKNDLSRIPMKASAHTGLSNR